MRNDYRVRHLDKHGDVRTDGKFPRPWYAERVFRLTRLRKGESIDLMRYSRHRKDWALWQRREA